MSGALPKRGSYVRDPRTNQVLIVKEHGRGDDIMVRPAYKSDGFWVGRGDVVPAADPHRWGRAHVLVALLSLAFAGWRGWSVYDTLTGHGVDASTAVFAGALPTTLVMLIFLTAFTRLIRN